MSLSRKIAKLINKNYPFSLSEEAEKELIILSPARSQPCGGIKVLYRHADIYSRLLKPEGINALVLHPKKISHKADWFDNNTPVKDNGRISSESVVVIPETMVHSYAPIMIQLGIRFCIFVQNGYFITSKADKRKLLGYYQKAECVLVISEDIQRCLKKAFSSLSSEKLVNIHTGIDDTLFYPSQEKMNQICYMPRKLVKHTQLVIDFLNLPEGWELVPIENKTELEAAEIMRKSKVFLSFSELEGLGLPPLEAALCGNHVIGYTGQAGREYFSLPAFTAIENGDIVGFSQTIENKLKEIDSGDGTLASLESSMEHIKKAYSFSNEALDLKKVCELLF